MNKLFLNSAEKTKLLIVLFFFHLVLVGILLPQHLSQKRFLLPYRININEAFLHELEAIPGLGVVRARNIRTWQKMNGPIANIHSLGPFSLEKYVKYFSWNGTH